MVRTGKRPTGTLQFNLSPDSNTSYSRQAREIPTATTAYPLNVDLDSPTVLLLYFSESFLIDQLDCMNGILTNMTGSTGQLFPTSATNANKPVPTNPGVLT